MKCKNIATLIIFFLISCSKLQRVELSDRFQTDEEFLAKYPILVENNFYSGDELRMRNNLRKLEDKEQFEDCITLDLLQKRVLQKVY